VTTTEVSDALFERQMGWMTARMFKTILVGPCWSADEAAGHLKVSPHLVSEWCKGEQPVPRRMALLVRVMLAVGGPCWTWSRCN